MAAGGKGVRIAEPAGPGRRVPAHRRGRGLHPSGPARGRALTARLRPCQREYPPGRPGHLVTAAFVPGDYLIKLTAPGNRQSYVPLTIWDPASTATYVIKNDVFTWQAWNFYGGYDYYQGLGSCPPGVYPVCNRARVVSYDRPYAAEQGSGNFLGLEYPLVKWAEQHGLDVTYATDPTVAGRTPGRRHRLRSRRQHRLLRRQPRAAARPHPAVPVRSRS